MAHHPYQNPYQNQILLSSFVLEAMVVSVPPLIDDAPPHALTLIIIARIIRHRILISRVHLHAQRFLVTVESYAPRQLLSTLESCSISKCEDAPSKVVRQLPLGLGSE